MSLWRRIARGVRALARPGNVERDLADELDHYASEAAAEHAARGLSPAAARRAARLELGSATAVRDAVRGFGWENVVTTTATDVRYAVRRLRAEPGFTLVAVFTLAIGIGGVTTILSAVHPILLERLPYPEPQRLATMLETGPDGSRNGGTFAMYHALVERATTLDAVAVLRAWQPTLAGGAEPERLAGHRVSARYFDVLGIQPGLGRGFEPADDRPNGARVVVVSDALWRRRLAADPAAIGRPIPLDGEPYTVVGVMPPGFENVLAPHVEVWTPLQYDLTEGRAWGHHLQTVARLHGGVDFPAAAAEADRIAAEVISRNPEAYGATRLAVVPLQQDLTRGVRPALLAILGAVSLVLIIACVNVANLLLARGIRRREELALRAALGAGRGRLLRQLLVESLLLSAAGGIAGLAVAAAGVRALVALSPADLPRASAIALDTPVFALALAVTLLTGLAFGLAPALGAARRATQAHGIGTPRTTTRHGTVRSALVVAEVTLALMLLVTTGLLLRSLSLLFRVDAGFQPDGLLTMEIQTAGRRFDDPATRRFFDETLEAVRRVPGVTAAALTSQLPLSGDRDEYGVHFEASASAPGRSHSVFRYAVSPRYLETMTIPIASGRALSEADVAGAPLAAVISASLARRRFGGDDPLGQQLRIGPRESAPFTIVGVAGDVRQLSLAAAESDAVYVTASQWPFADPAMSLVVRGTTGDPAALAPAIRQAVWAIDPDQPIVDLATMDGLVRRSAAERRFTLALLEAFAAAALVLAAAGVYGILSGGVAERTRELGVRAALGASRGDLVRMILRQGLRLTAAGVAIGAVAAAAATRAIAGMLYGVSRLDAATYVGVIALVAAVAAIASAVPAWRAARLDPAATLRTD